jgi:hypothetical protein
MGVSLLILTVGKRGIREKAREGEASMIGSPSERQEASERKTHGGMREQGSG